MAEEAAAPAAVIEITDSNCVNSVTDSVDLSVDSESNTEANVKRVREEGDNEKDAASSKKQKSVEEDRLEGLDVEGDVEEEAGHENESVTGPVFLGPKKFGSSVEMFDYFFKLLHHWPTDININKYEEMVLMDLLRKGHAEPDKKIGVGIRNFQVRVHPTWKSRCFFLIRNDGSSDDFSFRKCVDHICPLPEDMKVKSDGNKALQGGGGGGASKWRGGGRGGGHSRRRGGRR